MKMTRYFVVVFVFLGFLGLNAGCSYRGCSRSTRKVAMPQQKSVKNNYRSSKKSKKCATPPAKVTVTVGEKTVDHTPPTTAPQSTIQIETPKSSSRSSVVPHETQNKTVVEEVIIAHPTEKKKSKRKSTIQETLSDWQAPYPKVVEPDYDESILDRESETAKGVQESQIRQETTSKEKLERPTQSLYPRKALEDTDDLVEVNLEKTDLINVLQWIERIFSVRFLTGDALTPPDKNTPAVAGKVISYKSHVALSKQQVWDLFLRFLYIFGMSPVPRSYESNHPASFILTTNENANREPLPAFVGIDWKDLPDNDTKIRYVYFIENSQVDTLFKIANELRSPKASLYQYAPLNALIFSDISSNIRSMMAIISELDRVSMPEALSVLKLKHANASDVEDLYKQLVSAETQQKTNNVAARFFQRKEATAVYFPENTRLIAEPRTNSLIILGNREGIEKVESFIINYVDTELKQPYSPLYVYELQYANAANVADILNQVTDFGRTLKTTQDAAKYGGVRDGDKFFRPMTFIPEPSGNRLLIKGEKEDYLKVRDIIRKLDVKQPQVAIEVLIVSVTSTKLKELGTQIRNKRSDTLGKNVEFQTSGLRNPTTTNEGIILNQQGGLMGNLVQLASGQNVGSTLLSIGSSAVGGVWALFKALETYVYTNVVSHPFLTTTNKYTARVSLGETRRVTTGTVQGSGQATNTQDDVQANLTVTITPQINSEGIILLNIEINIDNFTNAEVPTSAQRETRVIKTIANVADGEILAIGGLLKTRNEDSTSKVPLIGNIPVIGWFFKNKQDSKSKDNLLVFISPKVVEPEYAGGLSNYSENKAKFAKNMVCSSADYSNNRDPIHRWFFNHREEENVDAIDNYLNHSDECEKLPSNWYDLTPGCPPNYPDNPISAMNEPTSQDTREGKKRTRKRSSMLDLLPNEHDPEEVIT